MPRKLRKKQRRHKVRSGPKPLAVRKDGQHIEPMPFSPERTPVVKSPMTAAGQYDPYQYALSDVKRALLIAGPMFVVLIILHFVLR